jgi:ribose transport system substrate-binding protein
MRLSTSGKQFVDLVGAQDDSMAIGARKAMQESSDEALRGKWLGVPFTGCDGLIATGQQYVRSGLLAATVVVPPNTKLALEMLVAAMQQGKNPPELALTAPTSFPSVEELKRAAKDKKPRSS